MAPRSMMQCLVGAAAGAITWTATEYTMHRWVLHGRVPNVGRLHRAHHRAPLATSAAARATGHVAIAGLATAASSALVTVVPAAIARSAAAAWSAGYSTYELSHWNAHHRPARTAWGERLRQRHDRHHFGAPSKNLGVTVSWWDRALGTEAPFADE